jgi:hypothetical protein
MRHAAFSSLVVFYLLLKIGNLYIRDVVVFRVKISQLATLHTQEPHFQGIFVDIDG